MTDLYSRLQELKKRGRAASNAEGIAPPASLRDVSSGPGPGPGPGVAGVERSPGTDWTRISSGVYERCREFPITQETISFDIDQDGRWYGVSPLIGSYSGSRPIFLDVETSGLSGGAGSTAFLIGLGFFSRTRAGGHGPGATPPQDPTLTVHQLFLSEPAEEPELLTRYAELVGDTRTACYVTYNGAGFDLPVLRTRHIMNRRRLPEALHWDLLPLTRRLYAPAIGSCTLGRVEDLVLGLGRDDDVPGSEVPARYHRFIDTGDSREIVPVLAHHFYDVAHLALLAETLQDVLSEKRPGRRTGIREPHDQVHDRVALAKFLLQRGGSPELPRCAALLDEVIEETEQRRRAVSAAARAGGFAARLTTTPPQAWSASRELRSVVARRLGQWDQLQELRWMLWEVRGSRHDAVELAKVLEHRFRDYSGALVVIEKWRETFRSEDLEIAHRVDRLRRKIARQTGSVHQRTDRR